jgi:hypothetical protein
MNVYIIHTYTHTYIYTHKHTYIYKHKNTYTHTYIIYTYTHTHIHTLKYIHTYTHINTCIQTYLHKAAVTKEFFQNVQDRIHCRIKINPNFTALVTGHGKTKAYLHRFKLTDKATCPLQYGGPNSRTHTQQLHTP